ncbi:putative ribonuclease H-like domain-containing protein [Tanacetum coccineum]
MSMVLGLKRLHGFLEVTTAHVHNGNYAKWFGINKWYQSVALRNFDLEDMEFESTNSGTTAKLPILKLGEYEMWVIRIKQYFQIQDYALWEVIENGDSWVSVPQTTQENSTSVTKDSINLQYPDAKSMFATIETRFGGNAATKKTQKTLLKQQYENFSATSAESLDYIFNRLQKIVSRLAILGVVIAQEYLNSNFLSSLLIQDYALWEVIENGDSWVSVPQTAQENGTSVTKMYIPVTTKEKINKKNDVKARSLLLMALPNEHQLTFIIAQEDSNSKFLSSLPPEWNTHVVVWMNKPEVETMSIDDLYNNFKIVEQKVKKSVGASSGAQNLAFMTTSSTSINTASFSDNAVYAFMVENPNGSNLLHQDLEQIHEDDLEAIDLKWQLSLPSMRAKRYYQRTSKKIFINANDTAGYDKTKVECFNCHKLGHFARDCRAPRSKEEEQVQTTMALMTFLDSEVYTDKTCSKTCLKNFENLKKQCDDLIVKLNQSEFIAATYKRGLATVEEQLITYRKNEFEKVKQEKEGIEFKIEKFDKASKYLDKLLESQITGKSKKGLGYSAVPPPHPLIYNRTKKLDLSYSGLDEFKEPDFKGYGTQDSKKESNVVCDKKSDDSKENSDNSLGESKELEWEEVQSTRK